MESNDFETSSRVRDINPEVVQRYLPLLMNRSKRYVGESMPYEEAYAWGALGLCKAARYYDPERNFASLAMRAIDASITDGLRIACGRNMIKTQTASLDAMPNFDYADKDDTAGEVSAVFMRLEVRQAVEELPLHAQLVIKLHYWFGRSFAQIASAMEVAHAAVAKLHRQALLALKDHLAPLRQEL